MKKLLFTMLVLALANLSMAQRSDFRHNTWSGNTFNASHRSSLTVSFFLGGLGGPGVGYAGEFEYIIGKKGLFSVNLPLSYATSNDHFMSVTDDGDRFHDFHTVLVAPGFRYHPAGAFRHNDFAVGIQLGYGSVITEETYIHYNTSTKTNIHTGIFVPMIDLSIQHVSNDGFIIGFYIAGGPAVGGSYGLDYRGNTLQESGYFHVGFKLAGNF